MSDTIESLSEIEKLQALVAKQARAIAAQDALLGEAVVFLKPFGALAEVCDHFNRGPDVSICSWKIGGVRHTGATARDCRNARDLVKALQNARTTK